MHDPCWSWVLLRWRWDWWLFDGIPIIVPYYLKEPLKTGFIVYMGCIYLFCVNRIPLKKHLWLILSKLQLIVTLLKTLCGREPPVFLKLRYSHETIMLKTNKTWKRVDSLLRLGSHCLGALQKNRFVCERHNTIKQCMFSDLVAVRLCNAGKQHNDS